MAISCASALAATHNGGLGVGVSATPVNNRSGPTPQIVSTLPEDGSTEIQSTPQLQVVFDTDMNVTRTDATQMRLPPGLTAQSLVWSDARTLNINYTGTLQTIGAKRVALFDFFFISVGNVPVARGSGYAFNFGVLQPVMLAAPTFSPAKPTTNDTVTFTGSASSPIDFALTYNWQFGDGGVGSGIIAMHQYAAAGPYLVVLTVTDSVGGTAMAAMLVIVSQGAAVIPPPVALPWTITRVNMSVGFKKPGRDRIQVTGTVNLAAGFDPTSKIVLLNIGAISATFTMDKNGRARTGSNQYRLTRKLKRKVFLGGPVAVTFTISGDFAKSLAALGFTNATTPKPTKKNRTNGILVPLPVLMTIAGQPYLDTPAVLVVWRARLGISGTGRFTAPRK